MTKGDFSARLLSVWHFLKKIRGRTPLQKSEGILDERLKIVVEASPCGMLVTDEEGRMLLVNSRMEEIFGYTKEELVGQPVEILVPERYEATHVTHRHNYWHHPTSRHIGGRRDLLGRRKDGSEMPLDIGLNPIEGGEERMILGTIIDITERKKVEQMKNEFVSMVSHELRTPLTSIRGSLGLLASGMAGTLPGEAAKLVHIALGSSERLIRLINDILDMERIEEGKLEFKRENVDLLSLIQQAMEINRAYGDKFGVHLVPKCETPEVRVSVDGDRLIQVLTNLLSNAVKFSPPGSEVVVTTSHHDGWVRISVTDKGPGIPKEFHDSIFKKFVQADSSSKRHKEGSGLGLSIAKALMDVMGGTIGFETDPKSGTTFYCDLPFANKPD